MKTLSIIMQQLNHRLRQLAADRLQQVARFKARLRAWIRDKRGAMVHDTNGAHETPALRKRHRVRFPHAGRVERSFDQLYEEVDQQAVISLAHFQDFLDAKEVLLRARQADDTGDEEGLALPIGANLPDHASPLNRMSHDAAMMGDATHEHQADDAGWDEDAHGGDWENSHNV